MLPAPKRTPLVSVVMATYNQCAYIRQALDSLKAQTLAAWDFEVIVVNDGSTDNTSKILDDYRGWIRVVEKENRGLVASCNEGLALSRGRYFGRVDSDDFVAPEWLERLLTVLQANANACCAFPDRYEIQGERRRRVRAEASNLYWLEACGTVFRTDLVRKAGGFRPFYWEEYDLYLRLRPYGDFVHVPEAIYMYRKHAGAMTEKASKRIEGWLELAREWGGSTLKSVGSNPDLTRALKLLEKEGEYSCRVE